MELNKNEKICIQIYQLKMGDALHEIRFEELKYLKSRNRTVEPENYECVYKTSRDVKQDMSGRIFLEEWFCEFNVKRPADFKGHSLSVSDVVVLRKENEQKAYYVDSIGFKEIPWNETMDNHKRLLGKESE